MYTRAQELWRAPVLYPSCLWEKHHAHNAKKAAVENSVRYTHDALSACALETRRETISQKTQVLLEET